MACGCEQQILEMPENVRTDRVSFVAGEEWTILRLALIYVEVVEPKIDEHLFELPVRIDCAIHFALAQIAQDHLIRLSRPLAFASQIRKGSQVLWRHGSSHLLPLLRVEIVE